jgi:cytochrome P450
VGGFKPQELANTAWAMATARHEAPALLDAIADKAAPRAGEFKPQELANTSWAFATAGHAAPALLDAIAAEAAPRAGEFKPQDLANTAWAFATAGHAAPALLDAIAAEAAPRAGEFNAQNLANTAWAIATAGHAAPALLDAIAAEAAPRVDEFNAQALVNTAWSFAVADTLSSAALANFFGRAFGHRRDALSDSFSHEGLTQLHQWWLWYTRERGQTMGLPSEELLQRSRVACLAVEARPSSLQRQVGSALSSLGLNPQEETRTDEGVQAWTTWSNGAANKLQLRWTGRSIMWAEAKRRHAAQAPSAAVPGLEARVYSVLGVERACHGLSYRKGQEPQVGCPRGSEDSARAAEGVH